LKLTPKTYLGHIELHLLLLSIVTKLFLNGVVLVFAYLEDWHGSPHPLHERYAATLGPGLFNPEYKHLLRKVALFSVKVREPLNLPSLAASVNFRNV
jgi:hypothetical protein